MKMGLPIRVALGIALLGAVAVTDTYGQHDFGTGVPGIASFQQAGSHSPVPLVAMFSLVSLILGLGVMFTRPPREQLTPLYPESGLRRAQLAMVAASAATQRARTPITR